MGSAIPGPFDKGIGCKWSKHTYPKVKIRTPEFIKMATAEITSSNPTTTISIFDNDDVTDDVISSSDAFRKDCICDDRSGTGDVVISPWKASVFLYKAICSYLTRLT